MNELFLVHVLKLVAVTPSPFLLSNRLEVGAWRRVTEERYSLIICDRGLSWVADGHKHLEEK